jgi:hypothetical protein
MTRIPAVTLVRGLFCEVIRGSEYVTSDDRTMTNELEGMWKEAVVAYLRCLRNTSRILRFSERWLWRVLSPVIHLRVVRWKSTDVSEEHLASIFRIEVYVKQETSVNSTADRDDSSTLKMETKCAFEASVDFQRTTWRYISGDRILQEFRILPLWFGWRCLI